MSEISQQDFKNSIISNIFNQEFSDFLRVMSANFNVYLEDEISKKEFTFKYKWRSSVELVKFSFKINGYLILVVPSDPKISKDPILCFNYINLPTLETLKKKIKSKLSLKNSNYTFGENDEALQELLDFVKATYRGLSDKRNSIINHQSDLYMIKLQEISGLKFSDISDIYFNFTAQKFFNYLTVNNFKGIPDLEKFPESSAKNSSWKSVYPIAGWELERKPDGYGHTCGKSVKIDWLNKILYTKGWSSDD